MFPTSTYLDIIYLATNIHYINIQLFTMLLLILLISTLIYSNAGNDEAKIVGGSAVSIEQVPYQASFRYKNKHFCGGSIYNEDYIITAGHCVDIWKTTDYLTVVVGQTLLSETTGQSVSVVEMHIHPQFVSNATKIDYDVAVLKVSPSLSFDNTVSPIGLSSTPAASGDDGFVTGWGTTESGSTTLSDQLLGVHVDVEPYWACVLQYPGQITKRMFCAGFLLGGSDSCQGDSGGPVVINGLLEGIVSFGRGCGFPLSPGVYTAVDTIADFIVSVTSGTTL